MSPRAKVYLLGMILILVGVGLVAYKSQVLGLPVFPGNYQTVWTIEAKVEFEAMGKPVKVSLALPKNQTNMDVLDEIFSSSGYGFEIETDNGLARAVWSKRKVSGPQVLYYKLDVHQGGVMATPALVPEAVVASPLDWSGSRNASLRSAAASLLDNSWQASADTEGFVSQLIKSYNDSDNHDSQLIKRSFPHKSNANVILDLLAIAKFPAHILRGIYLENDRSRISPDDLLEVYNGQAWLVFNPKNGVKGLPHNFLVWQRGGKSLIDVIGGKQSKVSFSILSNDVPIRDVALKQMSESQAALMDYSIYSLPIEQQSIFKFVLLVPVGALIVIFLRVVIGIRTAGTFMPVLLAIAFVQTNLVNGLIIFLLILFVGLWMRSMLNRLDLLLVSRIAAVVVIVVGMMAAMSIISYRLGISNALTVTFFPMIVIAWTIEHMSILWEDDGPSEVFIQTAGSLFVAILCYLLMTNHFISHWMFNFPELLLVLLGLIIMLGHYTGYRVSELIRFRNMKELS